MRSENVELTIMCKIVNDKNQVVLQKREKSWKGYAFPGGHIEQYENITKALRREMKEETSLILGKVSFKGVVQWKEEGIRSLCFFFLCKDFKGELKDCDEGKNIWVDEKDVLSYPLSKDFNKSIFMFDDDSFEFDQDSLYLSDIKLRED